MSIWNRPGKITTAAPELPERKPRTENKEEDMKMRTGVKMSELVPNKNRAKDEIQRILINFIESDLDIIEIIDDGKHYAKPTTLLAGVRGCLGYNKRHLVRAAAIKANVLLDAILSNDKVYVLKYPHDWRTTGGRETPTYTTPTPPKKD